MRSGCQWYCPSTCLTRLSKKLAKFFPRKIAVVGSFCFNIIVGVYAVQKRKHSNGFKVSKRRIRRLLTRQKAETIPLE
jgi:hypothetical protein